MTRLALLARLAIMLFLFLVYLGGAVAMAMKAEREGDDHPVVAGVLWPMAFGGAVALWTVDVFEASLHRDDTPISPRNQSSRKD